MTTTTTNIGSGLRARLGGVSSWFGRTLNAYATAQSRSAEINRLMARSDSELAAMGLTRERIVAHVFRDRMY